MQISRTTAEKFAASTLANVVREYPNHTGHVMNGPADAQTPRQLHPIFFGCFDWHSCVHGYWQLARLCRLVPGLVQRRKIEEQIAAAFTPENIAVELAYLRQHRMFERPYGWAWLLMLCDELSRHTSENWRQWHTALLPMGTMITQRFTEYLPLADYPTRSGTHASSAFALKLAMEFAESHQKSQSGKSLMKVLKTKAIDWYGQDENCQAWEPSQSDFLSPALMQTLCMSRALETAAFHTWLSRFLPRLIDRQPAALFRPAVASDRTDGHIAHLDGLNLSRAWCFRKIAQTFSEGDVLAQVLRSAATEHLEASLPHIFADYAGEHWLATFALLAMS